MCRVLFSVPPAHDRYWLAQVPTVCMGWIRFAPHYSASLPVERIHCDSLGFNYRNNQVSCLLVLIYNHRVEEAS